MPLRGAATVAKFLLHTMQESPEDLRIVARTLNGAPGLVAFSAGVPIATLVLDPDGDRVAAIYLIANPGKMGSLAAPA